MNKFANWVSHNCGFTISNDDLAYIQEGLSGSHSHNVSKEDFLKRVNPNPEVVVSEKAVPESSVGEAEAEAEEEQE